jgi:hypothetical protein
MDRVPQVEMLNHCGGVSGVVIHVVTIANLRGSTMAAPIMGDHPIALVHEVEHLRVPVIGTQRPTMMEDESLGVLGTPIFVEDLNAILGGNIAHGFDPFGWQIAAPGRVPMLTHKGDPMTPERTTGLAGSDDESE